MACLSGTTSVLNDDDVRIVGVLNEKGTDPALPQRLETRRLFGRGRTCEATLQQGDHPWIGGHAVEPSGHRGGSAGISARETEPARDVNGPAGRERQCGVRRPKTSGRAWSRTPFDVRLVN